MTITFSCLSQCRACFTVANNLSINLANAHLLTSTTTLRALTISRPHGNLAVDIAVLLPTDVRLDSGTTRVTTMLGLGPDLACSSTVAVAASGAGCPA